MFRKILATPLVALATCASAQEALPPAPATVVVAFDRDSIRPLIVEGEVDRETGRAVEANDPVRIASISKLIMALATLRLVDEGKVDLNADVSDYLGWHLRSPNFPDAKVTLAQLLSHRSGLRDNAGYVIPLGESLQAKLSDPKAWYADAPPGEAPFEYANLGSPVVATVLEAATGERFDHIMERTIFAPLEVEACLNWIGCSEEQIARAVVLYRDTGEVARDDAADLPPNCTIPVAEGVKCSLDNYVPGTNGSIFSPQGGVRIGMMDLAKIGQAFLPLNSEFLSESAQHEIAMHIVFNAPVRQEFFCEYGLAMHQIEVSDVECQDRLFSDGLARIGHAGEAYGLRSGLWYSRATNKGFAYFTTAVPPRQSAEDEGGFDPREIELMAKAQELIEAGR
ncbi:serine hydrolase domain-containing protein [Altererythrobacter rubellus]|jgi:CubicO group peptidase (beta-lactamase class C family)|uniref:Serine hydrolase domain-containing protein n=1 Tax=Altererythrobacter rubellus TaxID=2173831 RepID=A0A9Y2B7S8_9SPHN|nr:serine hydrolase domain-containing protein [Altererythrobacter rubellus]WIW95625.1 serine hydrolase domain-containing protein [Altererythrobacter rubellus]